MDEEQQLQDIIRAASRRLAILRAERAVERAERHPHRRRLLTAVTAFGLCGFFGCSMWWVSMTNDQKVNSTPGWIAYVGAIVSMFVLFISLGQLTHMKSARKWLESVEATNALPRSLQPFGEDQGS